MDGLAGFDLHYIPNPSEPEDAIVAGMYKCDYDGVMLAFVSDGEQGELGRYGTLEMTDGRQTRPLLLFHRGIDDHKEGGIQYIARSLGLPTEDVTIFAEWEKGSAFIKLANDKQTLELHMILYIRGSLLQ